MKYTFETESKREALLHIKSEDLALVLWDVLADLRKKTKYSELTEEEETIYAELRGMIYNLLEDRGIDLDELLN